MYYIYKITNKLNGHSYIGQTNCPERRFREHMSASKNPKNPCFDYPLYRGIRKYGKDNYSFSIIDKTDDKNKIDALECCYIKQFGYYNISSGGQFRFDMRILSIEQAFQVKQMIIDNIPYAKISEQFDISYTLISDINYGNRYFDPNDKYPLHNNIKDKEEYDELINLLLTTTLTFKEIANQSGFSEATVKKINYGKLRRDLWNESYPIRKIQKYHIVQDLLLNTNLSAKDICDKAHVSSETVRRINIGETRYNEKYKYPLRSL